jgi:hypothetical protein
MDMIFHVVVSKADGRMGYLVTAKMKEKQLQYVLHWSQEQKKLIITNAELVPNRWSYEGDGSPVTVDNDYESDSIKKVFK